jgi:hypothetical protein
MLLKSSNRKTFQTTYHGALLSVFHTAVLSLLLSLHANVLATDLTPGYYKVWNRPAGSVVGDLNVLQKQAPSMTVCVTPAIASNPLLTTGVRPDDSGCTASTPNKINATTETFTLSCSQSKATGNARVIRQGDSFVTTIDWQGNVAEAKTVVTGVRVEGCKK